MFFLRITKQQFFFALLIVVLFVFSMVDTMEFVYSSLSYSLYVAISSSVITFIVLCCMVKIGLSSKKNVCIKNLKDSCLWYPSLFIIYIYIHHLCFGYEIYRLLYLLSTILLCITVSLCLSYKFITWIIIENITVFMVISHIVFIILQFLGILVNPSVHNMITGIGGMPTVSAIFLSSSSFIFISKIGKKCGKMFFFNLILLILVFLSLILLKCRSAIIGVSIN